ncbi:MAG: uroporphyrinogen-III synthase [Acidimicrobiales bacterium]
MTTSDLALAGYRIGITADRRWAEQAALFAKRGAEVVHGPTMVTVDLSGEKRLRQVTSEVIEAPPDVLVVTTGMGLRRWLDAATTWELDGRLKHALSGTTILARGAKSASAVRGSGLQLAWQAPNETMEEVVDHVAANVDDGCRLALQLFDPASHPSTLALASLVAELIEVPVYRWRFPEDLGPARRLITTAVCGGLQAVTFTSQPAVHHLVRIAEGIDQADELRRALSGPVLAACVGSVCAEAAREEGIVGMVWPEPPRLTAMVRLVTERLVTERLVTGDRRAGGPAEGSPEEES